MKVIPHRYHLWPLIALCAWLLLGEACTRNDRSEPGLKTDSQESAMSAEVHKVITPGKIPPIDAAAPETFETATFGLG